MREEDLYELATDELNSRSRKADLWARACALATDDVDEARYLYTNLRVEELAIEHNVDLTQANQIPPQELSSLQLAMGETPDNTASLSPEHAETLSQRIPDSDDESNLTPAQLALKRVSESMGDGTSQLGKELSQVNVAAGADENSHTELAQLIAEKSADDTELPIDDSFLSEPSATAKEGTAEAAATDASSKGKTAGNNETSAAESSGNNAASSGMVLGDLTTDHGDEADNTIHIDAESPLVLPDGNSKVRISADSGSAEKSATTTENQVTSTASTEEPPTLTPGDIESTGDEAAGRSIADESLAALMDNFKPQQAATAAGISGNNSNASLNTENDITNNTADSEKDELKLPESVTPAVNKSRLGSTLYGESNDEENANDLHELIGHGDEAIDASPELAADDTSRDVVDELSADADENFTETAFDANDANAVAAMQDAGPQLAREFAIYQNASGIVSAVPKGGNLKAMFFTLPWLLSRRLWGHSLVYLLMLAVLLVAVLITASLVYRQWPDVQTLDMAIAGFFAVLAVIGLFLLPYKFANQWQEQKIAKQGFHYQSDQLASTLAGAEQSFLLGSRNRVETIEKSNDYRQAA